MTLPCKLRRFLLLQAFLWWQGGFVFYAAVVVPIGTEELGNALAQGAITQKVSVWLNILGGVWHALMLWDILAERVQRRWRMGLMVVSLLGWVALLVLHQLLGELFTDQIVRPEFAKQFRILHITYLWISTLHWLLALVALWQTLGVWMGKPGSLVQLRKD